MVVAGVVPAAPLARAPSEVPPTGANLLRLDSWRLPAPAQGILGRAGSDVFIDTDRLRGAGAEPQLAGSLSIAPSEGGPDAAEAFYLANNGDASQDDKLFQLQRNPSEAIAPPSSSAAAHQAGFHLNKLLPSPSEDEREWKATLSKINFADQRGDAGLLPSARPTPQEVHTARLNASELNAKRDKVAEEAAQKAAVAERAQRAQQEVAKVLSKQTAETRSKPELRASAAASMPAPLPRRANAAPATNAVKRAGGAAAEAAEPPAKKHRGGEVSLALQETPITDAANKMMKEQNLTLNSVKATDHWTDSTGRKCRRGCLYCGMQKTPQWRQGPLGPKTLCNACGVRYRKEVEIFAARDQLQKE